MAAVAAGLLMLVFLNWLGLFNQDVVYAMDKAVARLSSYHGILRCAQRMRKVRNGWYAGWKFWSEDDKYAIKNDDGTLTINNGQQKWQVSHEKRR